MARERSKIGAAVGGRHLSGERHQPNQIPPSSDLLIRSQGEGSLTALVVARYALGRQQWSNMLAVSRLGL